MALQVQVTALQKLVTSQGMTISTLQGLVASQGMTITSQGMAISTLQSNKALLLGPHVNVLAGPVNGLSGPIVQFHGVNLQLVDDSGTTDDNTTTELGGTGTGTLTGLGNLVIGYDENPFSSPHNGSHNLVVGPEHGFSSVGGLVAGLRNFVTGAFATVSGGDFNTASGNGSSVSGGDLNRASGDSSSVGGGASQNATGINQNIN